MRIFETRTHLLNLNLRKIMIEKHLQGLTNLIFVCMDFCASKIVFLHIHKAVTVGAYLYHLIYNMPIDIALPYLKNIR